MTWMSFAALTSALTLSTISTAQADHIDLRRGTLSFGGNASLDIQSNDGDQSFRHVVLFLNPDLGYFITSKIEIFLGMKTALTVFSSTESNESLVSISGGVTYYFSNGPLLPYGKIGVTGGGLSSAYGFDPSLQHSTGQTYSYGPEPYAFGFIGPVFGAGILVRLHTNVALDIGAHAIIRYFPELSSTRVVMPIGALGVRAFF